MTAGALCLLVGGCTDAIVGQYLELGKWTAPDEQGMVISGSPDSDAAAYQAGTEMLSAADWAVLEQLAPRPIWEKIAEARKESPRRHATARPPLVVRDVRPARDVPATKLPDGRLRMIYRLRNYGGPTVAAGRSSGTERREVKVAPADLAPIVAILNRELGEQGVSAALPSENAVVVTCTPEMHQPILDLLNDLDRPTRQVEITARIFEVKHDFDFQYGAQTLLSHMAGDGTRSLASTFSTPAFLESLRKSGLGDVAYQGSALRLMQVFGDSGLTFDATFQALADTGLVSEVASPRMTVAVGSTGHMLAGQELPILSARISGDRLITEQTTYKPVGVQLSITPQIISGESVRLHVLTVVSSIAGFRPRKPMDGQESVQAAAINPVIDSREAETSVQVRDGATLVIGGLRTVRTVTRERKVPGLGDIPGLGWMFKNHRTQREAADLYFFVTPRVIH